MVLPSETVDGSSKSTINEHLAATCLPITTHKWYHILPPLVSPGAPHWLSLIG
jgi:hypothetical protein